MFGAGEKNRAIFVNFLFEVYSFGLLSDNNNGDHFISTYLVAL